MLSPDSVCGLAQQGPHGFVAAFGDVTGVVVSSEAYLLGVTPK